MPPNCLFLLLFFSHFILTCFPNHIYVICCEDLCASLAILDKAQVKKTSNHFLRSIDHQKPTYQNFEIIRDWLLDGSCVDRVIISDRVVETEPPLIEFAIYLKDKEDSPLGLWISFDKKYRFYNLKNETTINN